MIRRNTAKELCIIGVVIVLLFLMVNFMGCTPGCQKSLKHQKSKWIGLNRIITLYNYEGEQMKQWNGNCQIEKEGDGNIISFILNKKEVKIIGGIVVVEEQ